MKKLTTGLIVLTISFAAIGGEKRNEIRAWSKKVSAERPAPQLAGRYPCQLNKKSKHPLQNLRKAISPNKSNLD